MKIRLILVIITALYGVVQLCPPLFAGKNPVDVTLVSSVKGTGKAEPLTLGLKFTMVPGWKLYGMPPDEEDLPAFGRPPEIDWSESENLEDVEILWPPGEWEGEDLYRIYVYKKSVIIPLKVNLIDEAKSLVLRGKVSYFACSNTCRPFEQRVELVLEPTQAAPSPEAPSIAHYEELAEDFDLEQDLEEAASLLFMLFIAFMGGVVLNFMPCVLPVLSLKIMGLTKAHHPRIKAKFSATMGGILVSFLALAVLIIVLQAAGHQVGWGFHFQQPVFLGFMSFVMIIFALNFYGWFEIPVPAFLGRYLSDHSKGLMGDFLSGMFATLLATPCSAPFLGTAISFALTQGPIEIIALFLVLGTGFSLPYILAITLPERWIKLPKPGKWMGRLQFILATALLGTGIWLASITISQIYMAQKAQAPICDNGIEWVPFNEQKIKDYVRRGKTVFVDITAQWCVTCHVNKSLALSDAEVMKWLNREDVITMRGDWTKSDDKIAKYLARHKRFGIPFNAVYSPKKPKGVILPEILTAQDVMQAFKKVR